ncbi:MAG: triple tyrosine motif-containing protein [Verrucomicrobiota bacterium]
MIRRVISVLALLVASAFSATEYSVRSWQSEDGLPGTVLRSIVQSSDGFLWIASPEGIARFDGIEFENLILPAEIQLPRIGPNRLFATPGGVVWFSGSRGSLLRIQGKQVRKLWDDEGPSSKQFVTQVVALDDQRIIARRGEEIWWVSEDVPRLLTAPDEAIQEALARDFAAREQSGRIRPDGKPARLMDRSGRVWTPGIAPGIQVATPDGTSLDLDLSEIDRSIDVTEILEDRDGNVWATSSLSGLIRFRKLRAEVLDDADGLTERTAIALIEDAEGVLWLGLRSGGVDRVSENGIRHYEFAPESSGPRRPVAAFYIDRDEVLWAAARDGSVFRWNGQEFVLAFPRLDVFTKIDTLYQEASGTFWFGGQHGLFRMDADIPQLVGTSVGIPPCHITVLTGSDGSEGADPAAGSVWFGTMDGRVFRGSHGRFQQVGSGNDLGNRKISALLVEDANHAWAATLDHGIHFWDGTRWHRFDRHDGLPDQRITCILSDTRRDLWLGSLGGIFRVSRVELLARIQDPQAQVRWLRIDRSDGLPTRECMGVSLPSGWQTRAGKLVFPTSRGLVLIDPTQIEVNTSPPPIFIRQVRANGQLTLPSDGRLNVGPGRTRLEFSYHGLGFSAPEKISYRTRLSGLDDTWREVGALRETTYEAVPPGNYIFEVSATNGDGIRSESAASLEIRVTPRFWETGWFLVLGITSIISLAAGTGWVIARIRMKRRIHALKIRQTREAERARISRDLHDDLGASLTELSILSALAAENPDDATLRPSLNQFSGKAKMVVGTLDEIVWAATPSEDSLHSLVEYLCAFAREFLENAAITLRTDVPRHIPDLPIGPNRRHNVFLAARESLNNAVKHARASEIRLRITLDDNRLTIEIIDNGRGFDVEYASSGNGLENLKKRMTDCGGTCTITSTKPGGSVITLTLPLPLPQPG